MTAVLGEWTTYPDLLVFARDAASGRTLAVGHYQGDDVEKPLWSACHVTTGLDVCLLSKVLVTPPYARAIPCMKQSTPEGSILPCVNAAEVLRAAGLPETLRASHVLGVDFSHRSVPLLEDSAGHRGGPSPAAAPEVDLAETARRLPTVALLVRPHRATPGTTFVLLLRPCLERTRRGGRLSYRGAAARVGDGTSLVCASPSGDAVVALGDGFAPPHAGAAFVVGGSVVAMDVASPWPPAVPPPLLLRVEDARHIAPGRLESAVCRAAPRGASSREEAKASPAAVELVLLHRGGRAWVFSGAPAGRGGAWVLDRPYRVACRPRRGRKGWLKEAGGEALPSPAASPWRRGDEAADVQDDEDEDEDVSTTAAESLEAAREAWGPSAAHGDVVTRSWSPDGRVWLGQCAAQPTALFIAVVRPGRSAGAVTARRPARGALPPGAVLHEALYVSHGSLPGFVLVGWLETAGGASPAAGLRWWFLPVAGGDAVPLLVPPHPRRPHAAARYVAAGARFSIGSRTMEVDALGDAVTCLVLRSGGAPAEALTVYLALPSVERWLQEAWTSEREGRHAPRLARAVRGLVEVSLRSALLAGVAEAPEAASAASVWAVPRLQAAYPVLAEAWREAALRTSAGAVEASAPLRRAVSILRDLLEGLRGALLSGGTTPAAISPAERLLSTVVALFAGVAAGASCEGLLLPSTWLWLWPRVVGVLREAVELLRRCGAASAILAGLSFLLPSPRGGPLVGADGPGRWLLAPLFDDALAAVRPFPPLASALQPYGSGCLAAERRRVGGAALGASSGAVAVSSRPLPEVLACAARGSSGLVELGLSEVCLAARFLFLHEGPSEAKALLEAYHTLTGMSTADSTGLRGMYASVEARLHAHNVRIAA